MREAASTTIDRLSPMDTAFLDVEDADHGMHLSALLTFDGEPPSPDEFRRAIERQLPHLPRFRQRVVRVPFALGRPVWVDDTGFRPEHHLGEVDIQVDVDDTAGADPLAAYAASFAERKLHPDRPLWDIRLVRGLPGGRWALAVKLHHAMVDGLSIMEVIGRLFSVEPTMDLPPEQDWTPAPTPSRADLVRAALRELVRGLGRPRHNWTLLRSAVTLRSAIGQAPRTSLTGGTPSAERRTAWLQVALDEIKSIKNGVEGTVNDVVLAAVAGALRSWMQARGDEARRVFSFVPVSLRDDSEKDSLGNQIGLTFPGLPVDVAGWRERIEDVQATTQRPVQLAEAQHSAAAIELGGLLPAFASRLMNRFIQLRARVFSVTTTNVPGPPVPVYFCGRAMIDMLGSAPLTSEHAMTIAALSYNGTMFCSVTYDPRRLPDGGDVVKKLRAELDTMLLDLHAETSAPAPTERG